MTLAIVLSAYNGEKYIYEQLQSLLHQERKADGVYICDDCSTDNTVSLIQTFIRNNQLSNWQLIINQKNKGWKRNFHDLIMSVKEDIIFLCDQDDIWYSNKVSSMSEVLENNTTIELLACGYDVKYEDNTRHVTKRITRTMKNTGEIHRVNISEKFMSVLRPGCSYAVRRSLCERIRDTWDTNIPHDAMLWRSAILYGSAYVIDKNLFIWRRYATSSSTVYYSADVSTSKYETICNNYIRNTKSHLSYLECAKKIINVKDLDDDSSAKRIVVKSGKYETAVLNAFEQRKPLLYLIIGIKYWRFTPSIKSLLWNAYIISRSKT